MHALENERKHYLARCHAARLLGQPLPPLPDVLREAGDQPQVNAPATPLPNPPHVATDLAFPRLGGGA